MDLRAGVWAICLGVGVALASPAAQAFCGFYVGKADSSLFNSASQVILVRDAGRTIITMQNDYRGELSEFALVVPVPVVLKKEQVSVVEKKVFDRLDAYSAPRLAEYYDGDPCAQPPPVAMMRLGTAAPQTAASPSLERAKALGIRIEESFSVGEYDIVMLSAEQSDGLETWLTENGYRIPKGASAALRPYVRQSMKFFVAKVNLEEQTQSGYRTLRPLQFAFDTARFMLPMRLGMLNANGPQDLIVYALTRNGRVENSNYRTVKLPADIGLPPYLKQGANFRDFYRAMFDQASKREDFRAVFTEYFWDMSWCDPCADNPLTTAELKMAGVSWVDDSGGGPSMPPGQMRRPPPNLAPKVMLTRLHVRYTPQSFPEDLAFQETGDRQNFQTRYVLRHPWSGTPQACAAAVRYFDELAQRQQREAAALANLTGWPISDIRSRQSPIPQ